LSGSGYTWWQFQTSFGTGWAVENWLAPASGDFVELLVGRLKAILVDLL
jgi:hypothetical protein